MMDILQSNMALGKASFSQICQMGKFLGIGITGIHFPSITAMKL